MKKYFLLCIILLVFTVGCQNTDTNNDLQKTPDATGNDIDDKEKQSDEKDNVDVGTKVTYLGQIDENSIEIQKDEEIIAARLSDQVKDYFFPESSRYKQLEEGTDILITYYTNENNQIVITDIK